jgi:murein DD-endopeptidase MepM/ murein hydrolase activator NlpD
LAHSKKDPKLLASSLLSFAMSTPQTWASYGKFPPPIAPYSNDDLPSEPVLIKMTLPVLGKAIYKDDYNAQREGFKHTGIDMKAPKMTPIVAPFSGRFGFKLHSFWIYREDGWKCLGTHLNDDTPGTNDGTDDVDLMFAPNLRQGDFVDEGQLIGYVGNSGDATAPHLHFEIYSPYGIRDPFPSLKKANVITTPVPSSTVGFAKPETGIDRYDLCKRRYSPTEHRLSGILVSKQYSTGSTIAVKAPSTKAFTIPADIAATIQPDNWKTDRVFAVYVRTTGGNLTVTKIVPPSL